MIVFTPNTVIKSADVNLNFDNLDKGLVHNPYRFAAYRSTTQNSGNVVFDVEYFDTNSNYSTSTGIYTCPITGYYQFNACSEQSVVSAPNDPRADILNGATVIASSHFVNMYNGVSAGSCTMSVFAYCQINDQIRVTAQRPLTANSGGNTFNGFLVST